MLNALLRPLVLLAGFLAVALAIITTAGRIVVTFVDEFESELNSLLAARDIRVSGLQATWHHLNPVVRVASLRFPGGHAEDVAFELDLLETAINSAIVARYLSVGALRLMVVRMEDGRWSLGGTGAQPGAGFDALPLLLDSDHLDVERIEVALARSVTDGADAVEVLGHIEGSARIVNERPRHSGDIRLAFVDADCDACELTLGWSLATGSFGIDLDGVVALDADGFGIPAHVGRGLGIGSGRFESLRGRWIVVDGDGRGTLTASAREIGLPRGSIDAVDVTVEARSELWHRDWVGRVGELMVRAGDSESKLTDVDFALRTGLTGALALEFAARDLDIGQQLPIVRSALVELPVAPEWIDALVPGGLVERISGRYAFADRELSGVADVTDISTEHYKGVPRLRNVRARLVGTERGFNAQVNGSGVTLGLMDLYDEPLLLDEVQANVRLWFKDKLLIVRAQDIAARFGQTHARAAFALSRPEVKQEQRISVWVAADAVDALTARDFVPKKMSPALIAWLDRAVIAGIARNTRVAYYGHIAATDGLPMRQAEIRFDIDGGAVRFHDDWPLAAAIDGQVAITAQGVDAWLDRGAIRGIEVKSARLRSPRTGEYIDVEGQGIGSAEAAHDLINDSPLAQTLSFIRPDWRLQGPLSYAISMRVPIKQSVPAADLKVELDVALGGVDASLGSVGLDFNQLRGAVRYEYPYAVTATQIDGQMFGRPAQFNARYESGRIGLGIGGRAGVSDVAQWLATDVDGMLAGEFDFDGELSVWPGTTRPPAVAVTSDLEGVEITLPPPLSKAAAAVRSARVEVELRDALLFIAGSTDDGLRFWVRRPDEGAIGAQISLNGPLPAEDPTLDRVVVSGQLPSLALDPWVDRFGDSLRDLDAATRGDRPLRLRVDDFAVERVTYRETVFDAVVANVAVGDDGSELTVESPTLAGRLNVPADGIATLVVEHLHLPAAVETTDKDPLAGVDPSFITEAVVAVNDVRVGDASYGGWQFKLRRDGSVVEVHDLKGALRGLDIVGTKPLRWQSGLDGHTAFTGQVTGSNLETVLPQFGYAPSVITKSVEAKVNVSWPGSPLNFTLSELLGTVKVDAKEGRFVDVESGGSLRMFSLLNFTAIAKRMALDFSDVFGKGISFDDLTAGIAMDAGDIRFMEPMVIDGTGAYFRVGGRVNFRTGELDNDMVVTLPVSSSLPWYAAYLSFVNPIAAGAVLVGERLFRNQIDSFSSATYKVTGTLDEPKVEFVRVFGRGADTKADENPAATPVPPPATDAPTTVPSAPEKPT